MWTIITRTLRDSRRSLLIYGLAAVGFSWMYIAMFPTLSAQSAQLQETIANYPTEIFQALGVDPAHLVFDDIHAFLSIEFYSLFFPIMAIALAISSASGALAGEIEKGTMSLLLSQPISRVRLYLAKYCSGALKLLWLTLAGTLGPLLLCKLYGLDVFPRHFAAVMVACFAFSLAIYSLGFLFAAMFSEKGKATFLTLGLVIVMYAFNVLASLRESIQDLRYASVFYYYDQGSAIVEGSLTGWQLLVLCGVALVLTTLGGVIFARRDVSV